MARLHEARQTVVTGCILDVVPKNVSSGAAGVLEDLRHLGHLGVASHNGDVTHD